MLEWLFLLVDQLRYVRNLRLYLVRGTPLMTSALLLDNSVRWCIFNIKLVVWKFCLITVFLLYNTRLSAKIDEIILYEWFPALKFVECRFLVYLNSDNSPKIYLNTLQDNTSAYIEAMNSKTKINSHEFYSSMLNKDFILGNM